MGAGNPIIRSFDESRYTPVTYFLDFTELFKDKAQAVKIYFEENDRDDFDTLSEEDIDNEMIILIGWEYESFIDNYFFDIDESEGINDWVRPHKSDRFIAELSAAFRGYGYVIAENEDTLIMSTDEGEYHHLPFGIIPKFKYEDMYDDIFEENSHKEDWYVARNRDFMQMIEDKAEEAYNKRLDKWKKKYEPFMRMFYNHWGSIMSIRNGAWTSHSIKTIGETYKFL